MILTTEYYYVQKGKANQARIMLTAGTRDKVGLKSKSLNIIILEEGERVNAEELNEKLDKLEEINELYNKVTNLKGDLKNDSTD